MRHIAILITLLAASAVTSSMAQTAAPPAPKTYSSSKDILDLIAKAKTDKKDGQPTVVETILQSAPYRANLEYRTLVGPAAVHEKDAEMFYVIDGKGTMVTGGKLTGETRTNAENLSGTGIEGGETKAVAKGDFMLVPHNTPHWFSKIDGTLILMSVHIPNGK